MQKVGRTSRRLWTAREVRVQTRSFRISPRVQRDEIDTEGRAPGFARRVRQPSTPSTGSRPPEQALPSTTPDQDGPDTLRAPVRIPDDPHTILPRNHPATSILENSAVVVQRQIEMMNLFLGFEQANRYIIMDPDGNHLGYLAERDHGFGSALARQMARTHRSFTTHIFDRSMKEVLRIHRPFTWISSTIRVYDAVDHKQEYVSSSTALQDVRPDQQSVQLSPLEVSQMPVVGEAQQKWAPLRRKYNLFLHRNVDQQRGSGEVPLSNSIQHEVAEQGSQDMGFAQFSHVNEPFLSWDFSLRSEDGQLLGSVNRNFRGFAREIFTDTGTYVLRMDAASLTEDSSNVVAQSQNADIFPSMQPGMTLDQRAVMLATAVSIDFDYFSRHSHTGAGFMPLWFMGGGAAEGGAAGAGAAGAAGAAGTEAGAAGAGAVGATAGEVGATGASTAAAAAAQGARNVGIGEGAMAGAGTMAGYEAMQSARERYQEQQQQQQQPQQEQQGQTPPESELEQDQWWGGDKGPESSNQNSGGGDGEGGSSLLDSLSDFFNS